MDRVFGRHKTGIRRVGDDSTLLIITNAHTEVVPFTMPHGGGRQPLDQALGHHKPDDTVLGDSTFGERYEVPGRALLLFVLQPEPTPQQRTTAAERSFQRVVQAVKEAALKAVRFGFE